MNRGYDKRKKMPRLLMSRRQLWHVTGRMPKKGKKVKPRCDSCECVANKIVLDHGAQKVGETRGRPPKSGKKKKPPRREHIGWYCKPCKIFFYPDGSPDWRGIT